MKVSIASQSNPLIRQFVKIALLLSGGVDSAVAAYQLVSEGHRPDCFYIRIAPQEDAAPLSDNSPLSNEVAREGLGVSLDCTAEEDIEMASAVARRYGLNFEIVDCHKEYWDRVARYTMEKVKAGYTPNPDVMCNRLVKFGAFHEKRGKDYDLIATGHYAQTEVDDEGRKWLCTSPDPVKDQTDFLAQLYDWQLQKAIFPIGHMMKEEVRRIAEREHLINAHRKDSQGICFLGKINYNDYIKKYLGETPGLVIDIETGKKLGMHKGLWFHTIGQRHGLGFGGGPWFAVKKNIKKNILFVSRGYDPQSAYKQEFKIHDINWLTAPINVNDNLNLNLNLNGSSPRSRRGDGSHESYEVCIKIRHTSDYIPATISFLHLSGGDALYEGREGVVRTSKPLHGVAPGQFCTIYDAQHHRCYGSAEITL
ncbi:MAG: tRNA 2-thiouridine(34) synthase MnmA [Prevotella sp.]|nr:tRNA 2-thiouridine(34) synthase MnmA [Prevotella sp.]